MRLLPILIFCLVSLNCTGQTQGQLTQTACEKYKQADKELNRLYSQIMKEYEEDELFIVKFRDSQRAWLTFRDSYIESVFPEKDKLAFYGSVYNSCKCEYLTTLTEQRNKQLKLWTNGIQEGDVCAGSIKYSSN